MIHTSKIKLTWHFSVSYFHIFLSVYTADRIEKLKKQNNKEQSYASKFNYSLIVYGTLKIPILYPSAWGMPRWELSLQLNFLYFENLNE